MITEQIKYEYKNVPIPGGGYVTGFQFHPEKPNVLYARTDIGGTYRYSFEEHKWYSLIKHVTMFDLSETFPIALALDPNAAEKLYIASGVNQNGRDGLLSISDDYGKTFRYETIPYWVHGNMNGRGTGSRLVVDQNNADTLYFASQRSGLLITRDQGKSWEQYDVCGEKYLTMVWVSPKSDVIVVGTAGVTTRQNDKLRGTTLYVSYDGAKSFMKMPQPESHMITGSKMSGYVAQRYDYDGKYLYITLANTGITSYVIEEGYSCDSGDVIGGKVIRYSFDSDGKIGMYEDITPTNEVSFAKEDDYDFGFSGISSCQKKPGFLVLSTICKEDGDMIYTSEDYGNTWKTVLYNLSIGHISFETSYMKPEYNGNVSLLHWLSDIKMNPFNPDQAIFNSGAGAFVCENLTKGDCSFRDLCNGIEETVHLNLYSPPSGRMKLVDMVGDLGGFSFEDIDAPCENTYADAENNRYITCINADYPDADPEHLLVTARGNWKGKTQGGIIESFDQGKTFRRIPTPFGITKLLDERLSVVEKPNNNAGWISVSADGTTIVWCVADGIELNVDSVIVSHDGGASFQLVEVYDLDRKKVSTGLMKVQADRVNPNLFYGFGRESQFYVSHDCGETYYQYEIPEEFPIVNFGLIDCANKTEIRGNSGFEGDFYLALSTFGLWRMKYDSQKDSLSLTEITEHGEFAYRVGLGLLKEGGTYIGSQKAIYICGVIDDVYGFFRSDDDGLNWKKINNDMQMFGDINSMDGDSRTAGRFYIATGSLGVLYGEPV